MDDINIIEYDSIDLKDSLLIVAFPTVGLISSIAGRYIIDSLKLKEIGTISSSEFMPATVIHNGRPMPPVRLYAGRKKCGPDGSCEQLAIIISEFMPSWQLVKPLVNNIFDWAEDKQCKVMMSFEGIHAQGEKKSSPQLFGVGSTSTMKQTLKKHGIKETKEGMITGVTGVLLYEGALQQRDVITLLVEAHASYPDSRAAGVLLEKLDEMLPGIKIDPEPLYKEAQNIEKKIRTFLEQSKPTAPAVMQAPPHMYG